MEIISMDVKAFDALAGHVEAIERKAEALCRRQEDVSLKKWLDNQDVCDVLGISKRTLQTYREKGLLPFSRIRHKIFYKPEDVGDEPLSLECPASGGFQFIQCLAGLFQAPEEIRHTRIVLVDEIMAHNAARIIPYYLIQGKVLYMESEIQKFLEDSRKKCIGGQEWV